MGVLNFCDTLQLFADTKIFLSDDRTVALDVGADQVIKQTTTLTYKHFQCTSSHKVFVVLLQMFCEVSNTGGEERDLCLSGPCVSLARSVLLEDGLLFFRIQCHFQGIVLVNYLVLSLLRPGNKIAAVAGLRKSAAKLAFISDKSTRNFKFFLSLRLFQPCCFT